MTPDVACERIARVSPWAQYSQRRRLQRDAAASVRASHHSYESSPRAFIQRRLRAPTAHDATMTPSRRDASRRRPFGFRSPAWPRRAAMARNAAAAGIGHARSRVRHCALGEGSLVTGVTSRRSRRRWRLTLPEAARTFRTVVIRCTAASRPPRVGMRRCSVHCRSNGLSGPFAPSSKRCRRVRAS